MTFQNCSSYYKLTNGLFFLGTFINNWYVFGVLQNLNSQQSWIIVLIYPNHPLQITLGEIFLPDENDHPPQALGG